MKKILIALVLLAVVLFGVLPAVGLPLSFILAAPGVATGIGVKLACSSRYITGYDETQAFNDIVEYSPILKYVDLQYDDDQKRVTATMFGISKTTASYLPGLGCAIDYPGHTARQGIQPPEIPQSDLPWPAGNGVTTIDGNVQQLIEKIVKRDNQNELNTRALLVVKNGQVIAEAYDQGVGPDSMLLGWSMAKSLTGILIGHLAYAGRLDLDSKGMFEQWQDDGRKDITLLNMLTMTDGLDFSEIYEPGSDATSMLFTEPSAANYAMAKAEKHTPGEHFNYSSGTANMLARIFQQHAGGDLQSSLDYLVENIYIPMGISNAVFETDASGGFVGSSYWYATARDWARIGYLMLNKGAINGHRIISEEYVIKASAPNTSRNDHAYGYLWWLNRGNDELVWPDLPEDAFAAEGDREQRVVIIPSQDLVIVRIGWSKGPYPTDANFSEIVAVLH